MVTGDAAKLKAWRRESNNKRANVTDTAMVNKPTATAIPSKPDAQDAARIAAKHSLARLPDDAAGAVMFQFTNTHASTGAVL